MARHVVHPPLIPHILARHAWSMIRPCIDSDFDVIASIINDGARAYRGAIPDDCLKEPYMSEPELRHELASGVKFHGYEERGELIGVMGIQNVADVTLIRHAYVRTACQRRGIGAALLAHLRALAGQPILIGSWEAAIWAIRFYEQHDFRLVPEDQKTRLLARYWSISQRQIETSVVLAEVDDDAGSDHSDKLRTVPKASEG